MTLADQKLSARQDGEKHPPQNMTSPDKGSKCNKMEDNIQKRKSKCRYYNYGYCRYEDQCIYVHYRTTCQKRQCKNLKCENRHPKECRYKERCRRKNTCMYTHDMTNN